MKKIFLFILLCICFEGFPQSKFPFQFRNVGPSRGGRVTAVCGVVDRPGVFYMGATGGGVWKSEDYGIHWKNISDGYFETPSIGAIAVYQKRSDIIYVGTGSDAIRSNVIVGKGIYKSMDAGKTWSSAGLSAAGQIGAVLIHPDDPQKVYAAVIGQPFRKSKERGVYRTTDGGKSWKQVFFLSDSVGAVDIEFAPDNPDMIYAAMWRAERKPWTIISGGASDGIYKSVNGGDSWQKMTNGLPKTLTGKMDLAVSAAKPKRVWAQVQAAGGQEGIYKSNDYGENWTKVKLPKKAHKSIMYRPFYFTNIAANPQNAENIWAGTKIFWTSYNGGSTWKKIPAAHADHHDLWIHPKDTLLIIAGNDGGASVSRDGGKNWTHQFNQATAELYSCYVDDQYPYYLYSGQQDNSTIRVPSAEPGLDVLNSNDHHSLNKMMYWERTGGCETGPVIPKPGNPEIVYANCKGKFSVYNHKTGQEQRYFIGAEELYGNHPDDITYRFQRVTPMEVSPHNPEKVYYGSQYLHQTVDGGKTWKKISPDLTANDPRYRMRSGSPIDEDISGEEYYAVLYAIEESPLKEGVIWTGANDGLFHVTKDGGSTWKNVTPKMPEGGRVSKIEASPHQPGKAYYAVYRDYLGDEAPYLFRTDNYGKSWKRLTDGINGIPKTHPVRVVREDPDKEGLLYAGTEFGLFISFNDGGTWHPFQHNLPITPITDIQVHREGLAVATLGRSFWVLDDVSPMHTFSVENKGFQVFQPKDIIGGVQQIHFVLPSSLSDSTIKFEFFRDNELIHSKKEKLTDCPSGIWDIRKTNWDLRYYLSNGKKDFKGPKVAPGKYTVRITYDKMSQEKSFNYLINPELEAGGTTIADLKEQEILALKVAQLFVTAKKEIKRLEKGIAEGKDITEKSHLRQQLKLIKKGPRRYDKPMLHEHIEYLYELVSSTPQKLGQDAFQRYNQLKTKWEQIKEQSGH